VEGALYIGKPVEARVATQLGSCAEDADGAELLEDVGVAKQGCLEGVRLSLRKMLADAGNDRSNLFRREVEADQQGGCLPGRIGHVVPSLELGWRMRAMAKEDAKVVQICCGKDDVVVIAKRGRAALAISCVSA
jgi:hypothetical protein